MIGRNKCARKSYSPLLFFFYILLSITIIAIFYEYKLIMQLHLNHLIHVRMVVKTNQPLNFKLTVFNRILSQNIYLHY